MITDTFKKKLLSVWRYLLSRDLTFWSVVSTLLLVLITFFLALATKQMADVMSRDYMVRTMPVFRMTTPKVSTNDTQTVLELSVANVSAGIAKNTVHHIFFQNKAGRVTRMENTIVGKGDWAKKLNEIPVDYVSGSQEDIKLFGPKVPPQALEGVVVVLEYRTLFDEQVRFHIEGFVYESDHNNLDPMPEDRLANVLEMIEEQLGKRFPHKG